MLRRLACAAAAAGAVARLPPFLGGGAARTVGDDEGFTLFIAPQATADKFGGYCLDGTPPGAYVRLGVGADANKWIYHQRGGAWCTDLDSCASRAASDLGSSKYFLPNISKTPNIYSGIMTREATSPFANWSVVFAQYCDGSSWTSSSDTPVTVGNVTLWFRGAAAQEALLHALDDAFGLLARSTDFVFTGTSAGGLSVFLTAPRVRGYFDAARARAGNAAPLAFAALPDSGFFIDNPDVAGNPTFTRGFQQAYGPSLWNASRGTNADCVAAYPPDEQWKCLMAQYVYPRFTASAASSGVRFFLSQSMADLWQTQNVLGLPCTPGQNCNAQFMAAFNGFQANLSSLVVAAHAAAPPTDGLYLTGCLQHGNTCADGDWFVQSEAGFAQSAVFYSWLQGGAGGVPTSAVGQPFPAPQACYDGAHGWC